MTTTCNKPPPYHLLSSPISIFPPNFNRRLSFLAPNQLYYSNPLAQFNHLLMNETIQRALFLNLPSRITLMRMLPLAVNWRIRKLLGQWRKYATSRAPDPEESLDAPGLKQCFKRKRLLMSALLHYISQWSTVAFIRLPYLVICGPLSNTCELSNIY
ncbi:uncharacterized protein LOC141612257 isoform X2 [Silene latifolia]|uniref:uncharacterized protein LOC141612257 isoform X2 n=1 Tax=Silene latifolia TaxID=37657 RepID=UPI003D76C950